MSGAYQDVEYAGNQMAMAKCASGESIGRYVPPTKRQKLENMKQQLEAGLDKVNVALAALDAHPDLEQFMNVIESAGV